MNKLLLLIYLILGYGVCTPANAEIYKSVDANGHITYSNSPSKGATRLNLDNDIPGKPENSGYRANRSKTPTPPNFPKVDSQTQNQRDNVRKQILRDELESEKKALDDAKKTYAEEKSVHEAYNSKSNRNATKPDDKIQGLQADVTAHEKNVQLLQKELDSLK